MMLAPDAADAAFELLAGKLGEPIERIAGMVLHLANVKMANAVRIVSVREGHDPRDFALVAFGGAGPLHACAVAEEIGIRHVVVPRFPGAFSAFGLLSADLQRDFVRSWSLRLFAIDDAELLQVLQTFQNAVNDEVVALAKNRPIAWTFSADLRYVGQASELIVPIDNPRKVTTASLAERFHEIHHAKFGYDERDADIEAMNLRLTGSIKVEVPSLPDFPRRYGQAVATSRLPSQFLGGENLLFAQRADLMAGDAISGPVVIAEPTATTFVPLGWSMSVDARGHFDLRRDNH